MGKFTYKDVNWKVYEIVNNGTVLNILNPKEEHRSKLFGFLHNTLGVMNFTSKNGPIFYEIKEIETGFSMTINWTSTKLKTETSQYFLQLLKSGNKPVDVTTEWRIAILSYLENLVNDCTLIDYKSETIEKDFKASLYCEIPFDKLYSFPKGNDQIDEKFDKSEKEYSVPYELIEDLITENIQGALKYFGNDHQRLFDTLKPYEGKEFLADFLIGATYYLYLDMPNKAYGYFQRALNIGTNKGLNVPPLLLDFIGSIEFSTTTDKEKAEQTFIKSILVGNEEGFLKLAYLYLQQGVNEKKEIAFSLAQIGEQILPFDDDESHRIAGYHIVASVYLWNRKYSLAEHIHSNFLANQIWCNNYPELVKAYLVLAIALNDFNFITDIITDYSFLTKKFPAIFDCWQCETINPFDKRFKGEFIETLRLLESAKEIYDKK